jgi:chromosome segregation ATPase
MQTIAPIIETGIDKLVKLVKERERISMEDAAKELNVSPTVIKEWSDFLEEEGIISIEYKFTKPFLVERKLTKKEISKKAKEFISKKEVFIRKAEGTLSFLEKETAKLRKVKEEFDKLKKEFGGEIENIRKEVEELERYHHLKTDLDQQIRKQKTEAQNKIAEMAKQIAREQKKRQEILKQIKKEAEELKKEREIALSIEESEKLLKERLTSLKSMTATIEKKLGYENLAIRNSQADIERLKKMVDSMEKHIKEERASIGPLVKKSLEHERKIKQLQESILKKIIKKEKKLETADRLSNKLKEFFDKKMKIANLIDKVNKDKDSLEKELIGLIKKAKSFSLSSKSGDIGKRILELEKKFMEVDKKKSILEKQFKKLSWIFRR